MINLLANRRRSPEVAIDLGTAAARVARSSGELCIQPSCCGGRRPLMGGVVVDMDAAVALLQPMIWEAHKQGRVRPRTLACTPTDVTALEREIMADCVSQAGAGSVILVPEPVAAAVGSGIDIGCGRATFLVDLGEGVTDCALIQRGRVVQSVTVRLGCGDLRRRLRQCARQLAHLELSESEAERLLRTTGVDGFSPGKDSCTGFRRGRIYQEKLSRRSMHEALRPVLDEILGSITTLLRDLPPKLAVEVIEDGIFVSGGGALLHGIREQVARVTQVDVHIVRDPLRAVVHGAKAMLPYAGEISALRR